MKSIIAAGFLLGMAHGAAIAGPYVNVENNSGFVPALTSPVVLLPMSMSVMSLKVLSGMCKVVLLLSLLMVATVMLNCLERSVVPSP